MAIMDQKRRLLGLSLCATFASRRFFFDVYISDFMDGVNFGFLVIEGNMIYWREVTYLHKLGVFQAEVRKTKVAHYNLGRSAGDTKLETSSLEEKNNFA